MERERRLLVYRDHLLAPSETFIKSQAEGLSRYKSYYIGSRLKKGLEVDATRRFLINAGDAIGRVKEVAFKATGYCWGLSRKLKEHQPELLHAHFGPDGVLAMPIARRLNIPLIVTFHGYDATTRDDFARKSYFTHRNYLKKRRLLQQRGELFIAVSDFIRSKLIQQGYPASKIIRHYIGVNTEAFQPDPNVKREPIVLFVGRLVEVKGCTYLLQAMQTVQKQNPDAQLVVIGDGPLRESLEQQAAQTLSNYRFLGVRPQSEVKAWMNKAMVFCGPSVAAASGAEEGLGMVFLEASSMGLPVVSFATGGIPEAVAHQMTGFLAKEKNTAELAAGIMKLLENKLLWQEFSDNGRRRTKELFDLTSQTQQLEMIYEMVLAGKRSNKPASETLQPQGNTMYSMHATKSMTNSLE